MEVLKVALLTSDALRHKYIANKLAEKIDVEIIITEKKSQKITSTENYDTKEANFLQNHFRERENNEMKYFGNYNLFPESSKHLDVGHSEINSDFVFKNILSVQPDYILLFGTSIIKEHLLLAFPNRIINLHLGLSPYYKGSGTNLWPLYYSEPECVGATFHLAIKKVDAGGILHQIRPVLQKDDTIHDIGNKVILSAGEIYSRIVEFYHAGKIKPVSQHLDEGKILKIADFKPDILQTVYSNLQNDMIGNYLHSKEKRDMAKPIICQL